MKKRILYVLRPVEGGIGEHVKILAEEINSPYQVFIACPPDTGMLKKLEKGEIQVIPFKLQGNISPWSDFINVFYLSRILKKYKIDLLHLHGYKAGLIGRLAARISRDIPVVLTLHNFRDYQRKSILPGFCFTGIEKILSRKTDTIITVSQALKEDLLSNLGIEENRVVRIYNGIDYLKYSSFQKGFSIEPVRTRGKDNNVKGLVVGAAARLAPQKGIEDFLIASKLVLQKDIKKKVRFLIAGEGPLRKSLEDQVRKLGMHKYVFFLGYVDNMPEYLSSLDLFVLPSRSEGLSITLLQALAVKRPVVATETGGVPEIVSHGSTGYLVSAANPFSMAEGIEKMLNNAHLRNSLAQRGQELVRENFTREKMVERTRALYEEILEGLGK
ncbi:MAG: glycosyltransferase family 1 protein [Candidatus Syntrophonatronum acetioxidans]|uniref:Glycosyltransferase family 1 protein n=1 Tax=Candidatus Syntrophonatronum acetioxidans TaxID=1795816 RepID=A0A424YDL4_9FIRM|nr:MAG: glycosyltransferase family 1 protein [Candidatus Syntrophonatronum acetioxidans]